MKKVLFATTALVFSAGFAAAEVSISGNAVFGLGYSEDGLANGLSSELDPLKVDDMYTVYETYLTISGTTESDNGLSFGFETTIAAYNTDGGLEDDGSSVFVSGAFGKLSFGSVAEADEVATFSDIGGLAGLGVDNVAEALTGDSVEGLGAGEDNASHNVNYTYSAGAFTGSVSGRIGDEDDSYALGLKYNLGNAYVGLGYADHDLKTVAFAGNVTTLYAGGTFGAANVKAMYSMGGDGLDGVDAWGLYADYTMGATTLNFEYADSDTVTDAAYGIGASYDLGGGAALVGGIASVDNNTRAEMGMSFDF